MKKISYVLFILIVVIIECFAVKYYKAMQDTSCTLAQVDLLKDIPEEVIEEVQEELKEEKTNLSLIMVGDYLIHNSLYQEANRNANYAGYDFKPMLTYIKEKIGNFDLAYYNQETILGGTELELSTYPNFNSPYEAGDAMIDAGFNLVSLATNHTLDRGSKAVLNSRQYWDSQENVLAVGSYNSKEQQEGICIKEKNGITYTMLNYTYGTNGMPIPEEYFVNLWPINESINDPEKDTRYQEYKEKVKNDIESVRSLVDVLIVAMHWGTEYSHIPNAYQVDEAEFLSSLGVDIIIGTHPHVIQPVQKIGNTLVIYSLGNFISAQSQNASHNKNIGLMTSLNIEKTTVADDVTIEIKDVHNELIYTYYSNYRDFKVIPFDNPDIENYLPEHEELYEKYMNIVNNEALAENE